MALAHTWYDDRWASISGQNVHRISTCLPCLCSHSAFQIYKYLRTALKCFVLHTITFIKKPPYLTAGIKPLFSPDGWAMQSQEHALHPGVPQGCRAQDPKWTVRSHQAQPQGRWRNIKPHTWIRLPRTASGPPSPVTDFTQYLWGGSHTGLTFGVYTFFLRCSDTQKNFLKAKNKASCMSELFSEFYS